MQSGSQHVGVYNQQRFISGTPIVVAKRDRNIISPFLQIYNQIQLLVKRPSTDTRKFRCRKALALYALGALFSKSV